MDSPFSREFWLKRGCSIEQADFERNSRRPIKPEYWQKKGYSIEESIELAKKTKEKNNKKGAEGSKNRSLEDMQKSSPRSVKYWLVKGFSREEAKEKVSEFQSTFSLEKCILKYGIEKGKQKWNDRQKKWIETMNSKSDNEKCSINQKKSSIKAFQNESIDELINRLNRTRNMNLVKTLEEFKQVIISDIEKNIYKKYQLPDLYLKNIPKIQFVILGMTIEELSKEVNYLFSPTVHKVKTTHKQAYRRWEKEGLLRSSFEIYFYDKIKETCPLINLHIDGKYPNSSMRYDFLLENKYYIEICPMFDKDEKYKEKMIKKTKLFGSILLKTIQDINDYIINYKEEYDNNY